MQKQAAKSAKDAGKNKGIFFIESCKLDSKLKTKEDCRGGMGSLMKNMTNGKVSILPALRVSCKTSQEK